jgi:transposase
MKVMRNWNPNPNPKRKFLPHQIEEISSLAKSLIGDYFTLKSLRDVIIKKVDGVENISTSTVRRILHDKAGLTYKKATALNQKCKPRAKKKEFMQ